MPKFRVTVESTTRKSFVVEAEDEDEAYDEAHSQYETVEHLVVPVAYEENVIAVVPLV